MNRTEELKFSLRLVKSQIDSHADAIRTLGFGDLLSIARDGDVGNLDYLVAISYFGDVVAELQAIQELVDDPDITLDVNMEELEHGHSVIASLLEAVTLTKAKIHVRNALATGMFLATETEPEPEPDRRSFWRRAFDGFFDPFLG